MRLAERSAHGSVAKQAGAFSVMRPIGDTDQPRPPWLFAFVAAALPLHSFAEAEGGGISLQQVKSSGRHSSDKNNVRQAADKCKTTPKEEGAGQSWPKLALAGIGSIIGAGFFLASGLSIRQAGPSVVVGYVLAGIAAYIVFAALAEMMVRDERPGSFRTYARQAFGDSAGFMTGWMYWISGVLIMSSEIAALSTFARFWLPGAPLWLLSFGFLVVGLGINLIGVRSFDSIEGLFAVVKIAALAGVIGFGVVACFAGTPKADASETLARLSLAGPGWFPNGFAGWWTSLIYILFSFGGVAIMGMLSLDIKRKRNIPKAGGSMMASLTVIYTVSLLAVLLLVSYRDVGSETSPFVTALSVFDIPYLDSIMNAVLIVAAFSTMAGALYGIAKVMVSLSRDGEAPHALAHLSKKRGMPVRSLLLSAAGVAVSILVSIALPDAIYEYVTTAAGVVLLLNWCAILASHIKLRKRDDGSRSGTYRMKGTPYISYATIGLVVFAVAGGLFEPRERVGVLASLGLVAVLGGAYFLRGKARRAANRQ